MFITKTGTVYRPLLPDHTAATPTYHHYPTVPPQRTTTTDVQPLVVVERDSDSEWTSNDATTSRMDPPNPRTSQQEQVALLHGPRHLERRDLVVGGQYVDQCFDGPHVLDTTGPSSFRTPDPMGAAGPTSVIGVVRNNIVRYNRDGTSPENVELVVFVSSPEQEGSVTDAHIVYDPHEQRFVVCATPSVRFINWDAPRLGKQTRFTNMYKRMQVVTFYLL